MIDAFIPGDAMSRIVLLVSFILAVTPAFGAEVQRFKDWRVQTTIGMADAFTESDSSAQLGLLCLEGQNNCAFYLDTNQDCKLSTITPALLNSDSAAFNILLTCDMLGDFTLNVINEFDAVHKIILQDHNIAIAIPADGTKFKSFRFSLDGSNEALSHATQHLQRKSRDGFF